MAKPIAGKGKRMPYSEIAPSAKEGPVGKGKGGKKGVASKKSPGGRYN